MASIRVILPCYLSNEFAGDKRDNSVTFCNEGPSRADFFLDRKVLRTVAGHWKSGSLPDSAGRLPACETTWQVVFLIPSAARGTRAPYFSGKQAASILLVTPKTANDNSLLVALLSAAQRGFACFFSLRLWKGLLCAAPHEPFE